MTREVKDVVALQWLWISFKNNIVRKSKTKLNLSSSLGKFLKEFFNEKVLKLKKKLYRGCFLHL